MPAEFVGLNSIVDHLHKLDFDGLSVFKGTRGNQDIPFVRHAQEGEDKEDLIIEFTKFCESLLNSNQNNFVIYRLQLYNYPDGAKKRRGTNSFSFQLVKTPANNPFQKKSEDMGSDYVHKDTLLLAIENANLKNKNENLLDRLGELEERFAEIEENTNEAEQPVGMLGAIEAAVQDKLPQLIDVILGMLSQPKNSAINLGIGSNIDDVISEFKTINPDIESDLHKLLQLAKNKPDLFKMLITQLRSM